MTRFLNISTDNTLGGLSPSDEFVASQKAIKEYVDNNSSNVQVDNLTINTNASDEIQTIAAINQNSGILKFWKGSKLEYDNLPSHDPDTQYTVTGDNTAGMMPTGSIIPFAGTNIPDGYLLCDGSAISRTTYADLFAVIGTVYGTGDGSTTFNVPSLLDYVLRGTNILSDVGNKTNGAIPNITGSVDAIAILNGATATGCFSFSNKHNGDIVTSTSSTYLRYKIDLDASTVSSVYSNKATYVRPKSMLTAYVIKY